MFITIDMTSNIPIYEQLKQNIIKGIATNELKVGEELPSVRQLAADLSINMHTIAKAYAQLKDGGFISVHRSKGAVVNTPEVYAADKHYSRRLAAKLKELSSEAMCRGVTADEWLEVCKDAYETLNNKKEIKK